MSKILYMTVGLPRSGKSTWARATGLPIVNPDAIRLAIHGQAFVSSAEPFVWAVAKAMTKALFLAGHDQVILDATNTTRKRRDEWKSKQWSRVFAHFYVPAPICYTRARDACREDLLPVIERMNASKEPVDSEELGPGETMGTPQMALDRIRSESAAKR